jgi:hypothetical protein
MNDKAFLDELIAYSLENLKNIEFVPNVEYDISNELLSEEANEIRSKLIRTHDDEREFYDQNDEKN